MKSRVKQILLSAAGVLLLVVSVLAFQHWMAGIGVSLAALFVSTLVETGSGKVGDMVISRNKAGNYLKAHKKPVNKNTVAQQTSRQWHQFLAKYWGLTLTAAQRASFNNYAGANEVSNKFGKKVLRSGFSWFMKRNPKWMVEITDNIITTCSAAISDTFPVTTWSGNAEVGSPDSIGVTAQFTGAYPGNCYVAILASAPCSPGRAKPTVKKLTTMTSLVSGDAIAVGTFYDNIYGAGELAKSVGLQIFFEFMAFDTLTGIKQETLTLSVTIQQNPA